MKKSRQSLFMLISLIAVLSIVLAACTDDDEDEPEVVGDVPTATVAPADEEEATATPADEDEATPTPADEDEATPTPADEEEATATPADEAEATPDDDVALLGDPEAGREIWEAQCMSCHTIDGSQGIGPTWQGLWMSEVTLEDGTTVTADEEYITQSILEPNAQIHEGFQPVMPAFDLSESEIDNIIAFIQTLEE